MARIRLQDEMSTEQERQLAALHGIATPIESDDDGDDNEWGLDPFEVLSRREERAGVSLIHMRVEHDD